MNLKMEAVIWFVFVAYAINLVWCREHCGFKDPPHRQKRLGDATTATYTKTLPPETIEKWKRSTVYINVHFHICRRSNGFGDVSDDVVKAQLEVLNNAFSGLSHVSGPSPCSYPGMSFKYETPHASPFRFVLAGVYRYSNDNLHYLDLPYSETERARLRKGTCADLNVFVGDIDKYLGSTEYHALCKNPTVEEANGNDHMIVHYETLPGMGEPYYDQGDTMVHETGHWLGLFHTFYQGCSSTGDFVEDTPPSESFSNGCPIGRNSCGGPNQDPIHNYMDYGYDCCMYRFTKGQIERMMTESAFYRGITNYVPTPTPTPVTTIGDETEVSVTSEASSSVMSPTPSKQPIANITPYPTLCRRKRLGLLMTRSMSRFVLEHAS